MFNILVNIDGGICSQMQQYLMGRLLSKQGKNVLYDLSFYQFAKDMDGRDARNFDLLKAFPDLSFKAANSLQCKLYRHLFKHIGQYPHVTGEDWTVFKAPLFMGGYYEEKAEMYADYRTIFRVDPAILDSTNRAIFDVIPNNSVAVHVRRGDLSHYTEAYGEPASITFFQKAISLLQERFGQLKFYFFSDGMDYVKRQLLPVLPSGTDYQLIENDAAHGYYDLILMSRCCHHITSKGSLAKFAACLSDSNGVAVTIQGDRQLGPLAFADKEIITL